ncbi:MAG: hypothetical protein IJW10_05180 [Clostridia bacterium]|nr:hypothetical protein [Clostridia bacterium]
MKKITSVFLVVVIIVAVLLPGASGALFDIKYMARVAQTLGTYKPPSLTEGYQFDGFVEGSQAVLHIISYPLRLTYYVVGQVSRFVDMTFNAEQWKYNFEHTEGGFSGGTLS